MKILAIDGSTKATGIAYYIDDKLQEYQLITASSNDFLSKLVQYASQQWPTIAASFPGFMFKSFLITNTLLIVSFFFHLFFFTL